MRRLTGRETGIVAAGIALAVLIPLYLLVFLPKMSALAGARYQVSVKQQQLAAVRQTAAALPAAERDRDAVQARLQTAERQIPRALNVPEIAAEIDRAVRASGVELSDLTFPQGLSLAPASPGSPVQAFAFSAHIRGTFPAIVSFLQQIESLPRLVAVSSLNLSGEGGPGSRTNPVLSVALELKTFALR